ncbi:MAG: electron transfer flavoprotein subunit alpha/FixB family protein [Candidatus Acetothermia bacterium]|jgi:electron transfer flavoprotein alpha subunit|nr:electron transfer flavoprotein subunit alpha/FixB family protein [Candidatus Acetothermia bacterium]
MEDWQGVWIVAEQGQGKLKRVSFELLGRARKLADKLGVPLGAVLLGHDVEGGAQELICHGADRVYLVDHPSLARFDPDPYARCLERLVREERPAIVVAAATTSGRTLMPILAARLHTGLTADCTELDIEEGTGLLLQTRPAIGGNVMATIKTPDHRPQMTTVRPRSYPPAPRDPWRTGEVVRLDFPEEVFASRFRLLGLEKPEGGAANIEDADVVVAAGKGLGRPDGLRWVQELAELLGGAVGASRPVVDQGWLPYPHQVGLSGKTVSPKLYIACGVSGAIQHLAGMRGAELVIAINKDPRAQVFQVADLAVVGDLAEILPRLVRRLREIKGSSCP